MTFEYLKVEIWLSQEQKELSKRIKKTFFLVSQGLSFRHTKQTSKNNAADTTFKRFCLKVFLFKIIFMEWFGR